MIQTGRAWKAVLLERSVLAGDKRARRFTDCNRLLIAVCFWEGDVKAAEKLTRYLADLETKHCELADLLLLHRFDCPPPSADWVRHVSRRFNTYTAKGNLCLTGWPQGCNGTWYNMVSWIRDSIRDKACPSYKAVFCCEPDGAPCSVDWVSEMSLEWDSLEAGKPTYQAGAMVHFPQTHINGGSCLLSCDPKFLEWAVEANTSVHLKGGWDYVLAPKFRKWGWADIPRMRSYYNTPKFSVADWVQMRKEKLIWVHGDKSGCLIDYGRQDFLGGKNGPE